MKRCWILAFVLGCGGDGDDAPPPVGPITAEVSHYDYSFDLVTRRAHAALTLEVTVGGDCIALPFRAIDLDPVVTLNGEPAIVTAGPGVLTLCGSGYRVEDGPITVEASMTVPLETWGPSQVGYSVSTDGAGNPFYYLVSWIGGCDRFAPCDSRPDRFATYRFAITHPEGTRVACPGTIIEDSTTLTTCNFDLPGGPTYSTFGVAASPSWAVSAAGTWSGVEVTVYDRAGTDMAEAIDPGFHSSFLDFMQARFGPYPYGNALRILTGPTYWNGFEHPGNIVLSDLLAEPPLPLEQTYSDRVAHILNHEIAHQWAGDETTLAAPLDFVWKEAMAEYLTFVHEDMTRPAHAQNTANLWKLFARNADFHPVPTEAPELLTFYGDVYGAGPLVLFRQLEAVSSREQVLAAIALLLGSPRAISVEDVRVALETTTGLTLGDYFDAWVYGEGPPSWPTVSAVYAGGELSVIQTNAASGLRPCKFHVELRGASTDERVKVPVDMFSGAPSQTIAVADPGFVVTQTVVDPDGECLVFAVAPTAQAAAPATRRFNPWVARPTR